MPGSGLMAGGGGSGSGDAQGQEPILPAVLEFPETHQELFLRHIISELDVNVPHFKLAPVYSLYLCARWVICDDFWGMMITITIWGSGMLC